MTRSDFSEMMSKGLALTTGLIFCLAVAPLARAGVQPGDFAIDFEVLNAEGSTTRLGDHLGDVVVLDFSAMW